MIQTPVDRQARAGADPRGNVEGDVVEDVAEFGVVVERGRVEAGDGEGHGERGEQGDGRGGEEKMHRGVVDESRGVVGIVRVVGLVVMVGVFGRVDAGSGDSELESGEGSAKAGVAGNGSRMGAKRDVRVVAFVILSVRPLVGGGVFICCHIFMNRSKGGKEAM